MRRLTTEEFISRLFTIFGDRYDYSKVKYIDAKTKVIIVCPEHGEFAALPHNLLAHKGCSKCGHMSAVSKGRRSLEEVIAIANDVHGGKYDYSLIREYRNNSTKYPIICPQHGVFHQDFAHHIDRGHGCPKCSGNAKMTGMEFVVRAKALNDEKYDYSNVVYKGLGKKVAITCLKHGDFLQRPKDHLNGQGCPLCKGERIWNTRGRKSLDDVKNEFKLVHGDKYDYSLFQEYKNSTTKIPVICPIHGEFTITPNNHLRGEGCPLCGIEARREKERLSTEEAIRRIREVHGEKFVVPTDFVYVNNVEKVKLICPEHGEFWQNPFNLWRGVGCPSCNQSKLEREVKGILTKLGIKYEEQKKFPWLGQFRLDFYLPDHKIGIECQGIQHFKAVSLFGGEEQLKRQQNADNDKKRLCLENDISMLYYTTKKLKEEFGDEYRLGKLLTKEELETIDYPRTLFFDSRLHPNQDCIPESI